MIEKLKRYMGLMIGISMIERFYKMIIHKIKGRSKILYTFL